MVLPTAILFGALLLAASSDLQQRRVANWLNVSLLVLGLAASISSHGMTDGLLHAGAGSGMALLIWFPMFALRLMGAGDVKLMIASGAWLGAAATAVASALVAIAGGVLGVWWLLRRQGLISAVYALVAGVRTPMSLKMRPYEPRERLPYAVAIATGVAATWLLNLMNLLPKLP